MEEYSLSHVKIDAATMQAALESGGELIVNVNAAEHLPGVQGVLQTLFEIGS